MSSKNRVLVIGANGGAGRAVAQRLRSVGYEVIAGCRREEQGEALVEEQLADRYLLLSLDDQQSIETAMDTLDKQGVRSLAGLINCAAVTWPAPLELSDLNAVRQCFETNLLGPLRLIQLSLPLLRRAQGRIVLVSSTSGSMGVPLLGAYAASKHALEGLADVLRRELVDWRLPVSLVIPGGIKTPMIGQQYQAIDKAVAALKTPLQQAYKNQYLKHRRLIELADKTAVPAELVADYVYRALTDKRPKARYYCGKAVQGGSALFANLPDAITDQIFDMLPPSRRGDNT